jgi:hypothetical protein
MESDESTSMLFGTAVLPRLADRMTIVKGSRETGVI